MFPYVPVYSLPINPHSALVLPAVRMHPASPLHMRQSSPRAVTSGYHMAAASQGSGLTASPDSLASLEQEWEKHGALEATNPCCPGYARLILLTGVGAGQTLLSPVLPILPAPAAIALPL